MFLSIAAYVLESMALSLIEEYYMRVERAVLFVSANALDYSGYPDCRPEFYESISHTLNMGSKMWTQYGVSISIHAPFIKLSKADIVRKAVSIGAVVVLRRRCCV